MNKINFIGLKKSGRVSVEDKYGDIVFKASDEWTRDKILEAIESIQELKEWFKDRKGCIAFGCEADQQFLEAYLCDETEEDDEWKECSEEKFWQRMLGHESTTTQHYYKRFRFIQIGDFRYNTNHIVSYWIGNDGRLYIETTNSNDGAEGAEVHLSKDLAIEAMEMLDKLLIQKK